MRRWAHSFNKETWLLWWIVDDVRFYMFKSQTHSCHPGWATNKPALYVTCDLRGTLLGAFVSTCDGSQAYKLPLYSSCVFVPCQDHSCTSYLESYTVYLSNTILHHFPCISLDKERSTTSHTLLLCNSLHKSCMLYQNSIHVVLE